MSWSKSRRDLISAGALVRWLEHVEGVDVPALRRAIEAKGKAPHNERVLAYLASDGYDLWRVKRRILTKQTRLALKLGVRRINVERWTLEAVSGRIIAVFARGPRIRVPRTPTERGVLIERRLAILEDAE